jgi:ubiquinone/menaquinone biosynthesis C-methylase UbiE
MAQISGERSVRRNHNMKNKAEESEESVSKFYNTMGWETEGEITEDARRWEDLRECANEYVSKCRLRVLRHIPDSGLNLLDMASGPIQYKEYLEYSKNFKKRYCVDLSSGALEKAKMKIGDHGVFLHGSFFNISLEENFFDCAVSLHTIYHIDKDKQEEAVRKLIYVTKPGNPVIIVYSNPNTLVPLLMSSLPFRLLLKLKNIFKKADNNSKQKEDLSIYFHPHPIEWWNRFSDSSSVTILPWRSFSADIQKKLIPNNKIGKKIFDLLFNLEDRFPDFFVKHFQYPMIILIKQKS